MIREIHRCPYPVKLRGFISLVFLIISDGTKKYLKWLFDNDWRCYWHFAFWYRKNNYKNDTNDIQPGTGDMNILAVPSKDNQPNDLLELSSYDEDWDQNKLIDFYKSNNLPMI